MIDEERIERVRQGFGKYDTTLDYLVDLTAQLDAANEKIGQYQTTTMAAEKEAAELRIRCERLEKVVSMLSSVCAENLPDEKYDGLMYNRDRILAGEGDAKDEGS